MCVYCTQWAGLSHSGFAYFQKFMGMCVYCTQWTGLSHSGRIYFRQPLCVCIAHNGRVYYTVGGCIFSKNHGHACVLHTVDGSITQWAGIFSTAAMCVYCTQWAGLSHSGLAYFQKIVGMCVLHTSGGTNYKNTYVCVCCTQWTGLFSKRGACLVT